jgi:hypothetical protein
MTIDIKGNSVLIDEEDYKKIKNKKWSVNTVSKGNCEKKYLRTGIYNSKNKNTDHISLHRFIMGVKNGEYVDHINGNTFDNRKCNLRICTNAENAANSKKNIKNTSGYKGVSWDKSKNKWSAFITFNYKHIFIGRYENKKIAYINYCLAAIKYFGKFARFS